MPNALRDKSTKDISSFKSCGRTKFFPASVLPETLGNLTLSYGDEEKEQNQLLLKQQDDFRGQ